MQNITINSQLSIHSVRHLAETARHDVAFFARPVELAFSDKDKQNPPEFIQVFPKGPKINTNDGRKFKLSDPNNLAARLNAEGRSILIDYDHRSHFMPEDGGDQTAAGWITHFEVRDEVLWAKVEWTKTAALKIASREYRFISPEFDVDEKTSEIIDVRAAALVNRPAFDMIALATRQPKTQPEEKPMLKEIAKSLGLPEDATQETILAAIEKQNEDHKTELASAQAKAKTPSTDDFMPRADYDAVLARANTAEEKLKDAETASFKTKVEETISQAVTDGKITPGSKDHYIALCTDEKQLAKVIDAVGATPPVATGSGITGKPEDEKAVLTSEEQSIAASLGLSEKDYAEHKKSLAA